MSGSAHPYTSQLQAGLGLVAETKALLSLWQPGMSAPQLQALALSSGQFPNVAARRLRNVVIECFAPRYLAGGTQAWQPARVLKRLLPTLAAAELRQLLLIYTCRANPILGDFVRAVYWPSYASGATVIDNASARAFMQRGIDDGKTAKRWSESTVRRVAGYLTGCCADYGLLEAGTRRQRRLLSFKTSAAVVAVLAHDLHFQGVADNALLVHEDWGLLGLDRQEVLDELRRLALQNLWIVQAAGDTVRIGWLQKDMETVCDVLAQS